MRLVHCQESRRPLTAMEVRVHDTIDVGDWDSILYHVIGVQDGIHLARRGDQTLQCVLSLTVDEFDLSGYSLSCAEAIAWFESRQCAQGNSHCEVYTLAMVDDLPFCLACFSLVVHLHGHMEEAWFRETEPCEKPHAEGPAPRSYTLRQLRGAWAAGKAEGRRTREP